jgi:hypothetical protein
MFANVVIVRGFGNVGPQDWAWSYAYLATESASSPLAPLPSIFDYIFINAFHTKH